MKILVTGFNGKIGYEVARVLKEKAISQKCAVRDVQKAQNTYGQDYEFTCLDFTKPNTFEQALSDIDKVFLMYPPGDHLRFEAFLNKAKEMNIKQIVYLSIKDVQFMPFIHHYKNEKLIRKTNIPFTFLRAGYFMQNLNDFLKNEIIERDRIFVPAGKGKTSFVDARDIARVAVHAFSDLDQHAGKRYVLTGDEALDYDEVAKIMSEVLNKEITYSNPSVKEFKSFMASEGMDPDFINIVVGVHFPTKLGLAKGIRHDYEKVTGNKPTRLKTYIEDSKRNWQ